MGFLDRLFGKREVTPPAQQPEHAVIVHFEYGSTDLARMHDAERRLQDAIAEKAAGELDGNEIATDGSDGFFYMYGADADLLFAAVKPVLESVDFLRGARVKLRYGRPQENPRVRELVVGA